VIKQNGSLNKRGRPYDMIQINTKDHSVTPNVIKKSFKDKSNRRKTMKSNPNFEYVKKEIQENRNTTESAAEYNANYKSQKQKCGSRKTRNTGPYTARSKVKTKSRNNSRSTSKYKNKENRYQSNLQTVEKFKKSLKAFNFLHQVTRNSSITNSQGTFFRLNHTSYFYIPLKDLLTHA
jgi:hypothetical protein